MTIQVYILIQYRFICEHIFLIHLVCLNSLKSPPFPPSFLVGFVLLNLYISTQYRGVGLNRQVRVNMFDWIRKLGVSSFIQDQKWEEGKLSKTEKQEKRAIWLTSHPYTYQSNMYCFHASIICSQLLTRKRGRGKT